MTLRSELPRKTVHIGMGAFALLLRWLTPWQAALMAVAALVLNAFLIHGLTRGLLLRPAERASRFSRGVVLYPAILLLTFVVFRSRLELAAGVWALLAAADGMATLTGLALRGPRLPWNPRKTWSGLLAFVVFGTVTSAWVIRWTQRAGTWTLGSSLASGGLLTLGTSDPSARIGSAFLLGDAVGPGSAASVAGSLSPLVVGCLVATIAAGLAESLETKVDDNILVPVVGGGVLWLATLVDPGLLATAAWPVVWLTGLAITAPIALVAYLAGAVDRTGVFVGVGLATVLYVYAAWPGLVMLGGLMVLGTAVTRMGHARKEALGVAEGRGGRRGPGSLISNTGAGVAFAFLAVATPHAAAFSVAMVAAFATALFDTTATELGQVFGRRNVLLTTWRSVPAGTTGGVSVEGTLAGVLGATALAGLGWALGLVTVVGALAAAVGALGGSTLESFTGALMGKGGASDHHLRNLGNTVAGAGIAWALAGLLV